MSSAVRCRLCSGESFRPLFKKEKFTVTHCTQCGLRFLDPFPDAGTLAKIYDANYFLGDHTAESEARVLSLKRATAASYVDILSSESVKSGARGRILEIGCGRGELLLEAQSRGFEVNGIEFSPDATASANKLLGADKVISGTIDDAPFKDNIFDVILFADVIEHVQDPMGFLKSVHTLLKPGGTVMLVTPSLDSWSSKLMGRHWMEYKVEHIFYFSRQTISQALSAAGFHDVKIRSNVKVLSFDYICHHFRKYPVPLVSTVVRVMRAMTPGFLANRQMRIVASGIIAMARK